MGPWASATEKTAWPLKLWVGDSILRAVAVVSLDVIVATVEVVVAVVEVDEMVSFLTGGEADPLWPSCSPGDDCDSGLAARLEPFRDSSLLGGASARPGAGCILSLDDL
jgi:hypothetical protein